MANGTDLKLDLTKAAVPVSILIAAAAAIGSITWFLSGLERASTIQDLKIESKLNGIESHLMRIDDNFDEVVEEAEFLLWTERLRSRNPTVEVPPFDAK